MKFSPTSVEGVVLVEQERHSDDRGFFARTWCREEFEKAGLNPLLDQTSVSFNQRRGTLRGMHWQAKPHGETKLVRCTQGAIYDVALDLREGSPTHGKWFATELSAENGKALYIPDGIAHGFQTIQERSEVYYMMAGTYHPDSARGARWNDPQFGIEWPLAEIAHMSERDADYADWKAG
ncbi:MAG: dTDP-4-dehydrorhamnose 3,5-epimerase [Verrucomicrobiales bacterium]|nr:dTDP-4-dehydrorhamnose 3,5-epimerase [Verrucomicrobiales bacterium]|tara:strand:- start:11451 stop:11987 length:537 start_codon:yes stop_codon:yes gene_type:complete